jgi:hypothetical protein
MKTFSFNIYHHESNFKIKKICFFLSRLLVLFFIKEAKFKQINGKKLRTQVNFLRFVHKKSTHET